MIDKVVLTKPSTNAINTALTLTGSKSESNRALILQAVSGNAISLKNIGIADDTVGLQDLLQQHHNGATVLDAGPAGTTFRFLTAYLACQKGTVVLTGSERMKERPVGALVDALRGLNATIEYTEKEGYPPLKISGTGALKGGKTSIPGDISSQFISAILLSAPAFTEGLDLHITGEIHSIPYINMTVAFLREAGVEVQTPTEGNIKIKPAQKLSGSLHIEPDWSGASYWYAICALSEQATITLNGFKKTSLQGDKALVDIFENLGVQTKFTDTGIILTKDKNLIKKELAWDFTHCPDLAQTIFAVCAALKVKGNFTGLKSLRIKETDRVVAMQTELKKLGYALTFNEATSDVQIIPENNSLQKAKFIHTYHDHRMAMAIAPMVLAHESLGFENPAVVGKSYPNFWKDLEAIGFKAEMYGG